MFNWASFLSYVFITAYTPGPNNIMSMNNASRHGFVKGVPFNFGIWAAFSIVMLLCTLLSASLYAVVPRIQLPMKMAGAAYMLYLAWKTAHSPTSAAGRESNGGFWAGFALQFVNPKIYIYGITAMSSYVLPRRSDPLVVVSFALLLAFVGFTGTLCWALFGSLFTTLFYRHSRAMSAVMAALLVYCAISLFI
jgi:cysteine/O-acetylserine efflux protein